VTSAISTVEVEVEGGVIRTRIAGRGPDLVLVHGVLVSNRVWDLLIDLLGDRYRLVMPDMPFGAHQVPLAARADRSVTAHARRLATVIDTICEGQPAVLGNDTGGAVVQHLCRDSPDRIGSLILASCDAFWNCPPWILMPLAPLFRLPRFVDAFAVAARLDAIAWTLLKFVARTAPDSTHRAELLGSFLTEAEVRRDLAGLVVGLRPIVTRSCVPTLARWSKPALVVWGRPDPVFPASHARRLVELIPDAELAWVEGSRALLALDQPEQLAAHLSAFLEKGS
jgi:pimeloyl-ACP methyl ester carboxylesterase